MPSALKLPPEEQHVLSEKKKLANKLKERSSPEKFYIITPPKDETKLDKKRQELEFEIHAFETMIAKKQVQERAQKTLENMITKKKADLAGITEELKGSVQTIKSGTLQFAEKMRSYTNEECKILIGILYEGKVPTKNHQCYNNYIKNSKLVEDVLKDWSELSTSESGKAFLAHEKEWRKYVSMNTFGIIDTLRRRMLPEKNIDYLKEPVYKIPPYKATKVFGQSGTIPLKPISNSVVIPPQQSDGSSYVDELKIKSNGGLKKVIRKPYEPLVQSEKSFFLPKQASKVK